MHTPISEVCEEVRGNASQLSHVLFYRSDQHLAQGAVTPHSGIDFTHVEKLLRCCEQLGLTPQLLMTS